MNNDKLSQQKKDFYDNIAYLVGVVAVAKQACATARTEAELHHAKDIFLKQLKETEYNLSKIIIREEPEKNHTK